MQKYRSFVADQLPPISLHEPVTAGRYCENQLTCKKAFSDHPKHSTILCKAVAKGQRDDGNRQCGQFLIEELVVMILPIKPGMY